MMVLVDRLIGTYLTRRGFSEQKVVPDKDGNEVICGSLFEMAGRGFLRGKLGLVALFFCDLKAHRNPATGQRTLQLPFKMIQHAHARRQIVDWETDPVKVGKLLLVPESVTNASGGGGVDEDMIGIGECFTE